MYDIFRDATKPKCLGILGRSSKNLGASWNFLCMVAWQCPLKYLEAWKRPPCRGLYMVPLYKGLQSPLSLYIYRVANNLCDTHTLERVCETSYSEGLHTTPMQIHFLCGCMNPPCKLLLCNSLSVGILHNPRATRFRHSWTVTIRVFGAFNYIFPSFLLIAV